jgi:hypothetical protein
LYFWKSIMSYTAPVKDMLFVINELAHLDRVSALAGFEDATADTAQAVLDEAAKFSADVIAPLNFEGNRNPSTWRDGRISLCRILGSRREIDTARRQRFGNRQGQSIHAVRTS